MLTDEGTTIIKFFLVIDRDEQKARLEARRDDPKGGSSRPPTSPNAALGRVRRGLQCLERTSTSNAPWYLIPSNRKWFRNLAVSRIVAETLEALDPAYPPPEPGSADLVVE
jgi:polyphosphate kinase 2 (PPK2 family)